MTLEETRKTIDTIDSQIRKLLTERLECSYQVAQIKHAVGETNIYRADREEAILRRLSEGIPEEQAAVYLAVVRKIMETSRMYQYGLLYEWMGEGLNPYPAEIDLNPELTHVCIRVTRENRPNAMAAVLSMIGDYGYNMHRMEFKEEDKERNEVTFDLDMIGNLNEIKMKKLMFQLSKECSKFSFLGNY